MKKITTITSQEKWSLILNRYNIIWNKIYRLSFYITKYSKLQWLQYRINYRILGTNKLLYKIKVSQNNKCTFCSDSIETIEHIFWTCPKVFDVWEELDKWIYSKVQIELPFNLDIVLFGILEKTEKKLHKKSHNTIN